MKSSWSKRIVLHDEEITIFQDLMNERRLWYETQYAGVHSSIITYAIENEAYVKEIMELFERF